MSENGEEKPAGTEETKSVEKAPPPVEDKKEEEVPQEKKVNGTEKKAENGDKETESCEKKTASGDQNKTEDSEGKKPEENGADADKKSVGFKERFRQFSKFGDTKSDGKMITLSQSDKWMKQAKVIDKKITTTDTGIHFKKFKMQKISFSDYEKFLEDLAKSKKVEVEEIKKKMVDCGAPGFTGATGAAAKGSPSAVERLTDVSKYTGSHKQRFDEAGKGKGIAGRKDTPDKSGYVHGYQNKDTYNKTH